MENCPQRNLIEAVNSLVERLETPLPAVPEDEDIAFEVEVRKPVLSTPEVSLRLTSPIKCELCDEMVVDLTNGMVYCGQEVPQTILESNARIQNS